MENHERPDRSTSTQKMLEVLCSVVVGDADKEDIIDLLKRDEVDSLEYVTRILTRGEPMAATEAARRPPRRSRKNRTASAPNVHQVPEVPVLLNGTLYDPEDVRRFDGQALHFVPAANREYLLAVDDINTMVHWWRLLNWASLEDYKEGHYGSGKRVTPADQSGSGDITPQDHDPPPGPEGPIACIFVFSELFEHMDFEGDRLPLERARCPGWDSAPQNYPHLGHVSRGFLGLGDWNDIVSSVRVVHGTCVLFEHRYFGVLDGGSSLMLTQSEPFLGKFGFNDRASSVDAF